MGDSYAGSGKGPTGHNGIGDQGERQGFVGGKAGSQRRASKTQGPSVPAGWTTRNQPERLLGVPGFKAKDLMMMPARLAIALQEDGWYLRSEITWCKSSAMPESVGDRPTSATERIYLLSKSARYFYDGDAVRVPHVEPNGWSGRHGISRDDYQPSTQGFNSGAGGMLTKHRDYNPLGANLRNFWLLGPQPSVWDYCNACGRLFVGADRRQIKKRGDVRVCPCGASDWVAHYATYPEEIPRRAINAGTSLMGACPACRAPWVRMTESSYRKHRPSGSTEARSERGNRVHDGGAGGWGSFGTNLRKDVTTTGWQPSCTCPPADPVPCVVLDPFSGSATTGRVARQLGRRYIGLELSDRYAAASEALLDREGRPLLNAIADTYRQTSFA